MLMGLLLPTFTLISSRNLIYGTSFRVFSGSCSRETEASKDSFLNCLLNLEISLAVHLRLKLKED